MMMRPDGRLTRRGRLTRTFVVFGVMCAAVIMGSQAFADSSIDARRSPAPAPAGDTYTVSAGDTLWGIAEVIAGPGQSTRTVVNQIKDLNHLDNASIAVGDQLWVPASA